MMFSDMVFVRFQISISNGLHVDGIALSVNSHFSKLSNTRIIWAPQTSLEKDLGSCLFQKLPLFLRLSNAKVPNIDSKRASIL